MSNKGNELIDLVVCCINPSGKELFDLDKILKQTKLNFKIVAVYEENVYIVGKYSNNYLYFVTDVGKDEVEYKGLQASFFKYFSHTYILLRHGDSFENLKYLIAYYTTNDYEFVMMNEDEKYYDKLFNKVYCIDNPRFTVGSGFSIMSYKFLKLLLKDSRKSSDFTQEAILLCEKHPEIKSSSLNIKGPMSPASKSAINKIKWKAFLTDARIISLILCLPLIIGIMSNDFSTLRVTIFFAEFAFCCTLINVAKKTYYNRVFFKRREKT